jgi:hypothetical protein
LIIQAELPRAIQSAARFIKTRYTQAQLGAPDCELDQRPAAQVLQNLLEPPI